MIPFAMFTMQARRVISRSHDQAASFNHDAVRTEHLLLALIDEQVGVAAQALASLGITPDAVRMQVERIAGRGQLPPVGLLPFSPAAKTTLELASQEARQLDDDYLRAEHLLLGLIQEGAGLAARVLAQAGATYDLVHAQVTRLTADSPPTALDELP